MSDRLKQLADSYLDHIRIAVEAGDRGHPFATLWTTGTLFAASMTTIAAAEIGRDGSIILRHWRGR
jgi:hypothetical protein